MTEDLERKIVNLNKTIDRLSDERRRLLIQIGYLRRQNEILHATVTQYEEEENERCASE